MFLGGGTHPHHVGFHACEKTVVFFERFPYVCPEPILVKCSCYLELARKGAYSHTECLPEAVAHQQQRKIHVARHAAENAFRLMPVSSIMYIMYCDGFIVC
jgi:hypothetical protein